MAIPAGENVYDVYGTVLFRVIDEERHALEMSGLTRFSEDVAEMGNPPTASGHETITGTGQKSTITSANTTLKRKPGRLDPISTTVDTAVRAAPLTNTFGDSTKKLAGKSLASNDPTKGSGAGSYQLTVERALAQLFPPTELTEEGAKGMQDNSREEGEKWLKVAALDHVSRLDVVQLFQHLQKRCVEEHARPQGVLCPTREAIFDDGMKEVMRQLTVLCPERGLLLRDLSLQMSQSTVTYDVLAENASQYGVRKSTERDLRRHLFDEQAQLESEVRRIENRVNELRAKFNGVQKRFKEQKESNQTLREEEIAYIKKANQQIVNEIKRLSNLEAQQR